MMHRCLFLLASLAIICCSNAANHWIKLNHFGRSVCFMGKHNQAGVFHSRYAGFAAAVKLVHKSGTITCTQLPGGKHNSNFGCHKLPMLGKYSLNVVVTNSDNQIKFPTSGMSLSPIYKHIMWYALDGVDSKSKEIVLPGSFSHPYYVNKGQVLKVWYGEDLFNTFEGDNAGRVCVDVYGYLI